MKNKLATVVAILLSLFAMLAVYTVMQKKEKAIGVPVKVAISTGLLGPGSKFERSSFTWFQMPKAIYDRMAESLITDVEMDEYIDKKKIQQEIREGQFVLKSHFLRGIRGKEEGETIEGKLREPGSRAISISVDFIQGVSGLLKPGSRVDIIGVFSFNIKGFGAYQVTAPLMEDKEVLALDSYSQVTLGDGPVKKLSEYTSVTLKVKRFEALILTHSQNFGKNMHLVLRRKLAPAGDAPDAIDNYDIIKNLKLPIRTHPLVKDKIDRRW